MCEFIPVIIVNILNVAYNKLSLPVRKVLYLFDCPQNVTMQKDKTNVKGNHLDLIHEFCKIPRHIFPFFTFFLPPTPPPNTHPMPRLEITEHLHAVVNHFDMSASSLSTSQTYIYSNAFGALKVDTA